MAKTNSVKKITYKKYFTSRQKFLKNLILESTENFIWLNFGLKKAYLKKLLTRMAWKNSVTERNHFSLGQKIPRRLILDKLRNVFGAKFFWGKVIGI